MLQPVRARTFGTEIGKVAQPISAVKQLLYAVGSDETKLVDDLYPLATAAALDGIAMRCQALRDEILEEAGLA